MWRPLLPRLRAHCPVVPFRLMQSGGHSNSCQLRGTNSINRTTSAVQRGRGLRLPAALAGVGEGGRR
jgi:hypothetical protein